jgi:O-methyltransferase
MVHREQNHSKAVAGDFQDTTIDLVLSRMTHPDRVSVRKGYFPETTNGLEDTFAFVSLDVDLQADSGGPELLLSAALAGRIHLC